METKNIKDLDCSKMKIHPSHPQLVNWMEDNIYGLKQASKRAWSKGFTKAMVFRYVVLMYDPNSPIHEMFGLDYFGKKYEAVSYAGFELKKSKHDGQYRFDEKVNDMVAGKNKGVTDIIVHFLAWINSYKWQELVYLSESLMHYVTEALGGNPGDSKTVKDVRVIRQDMKKLIEEVAREKDETEEFMARFYWQIEQSRLKVRPENYSQKIIDGDDFRGDSPYSVNYMVDKITFIGEKMPDEVRK